MRAALSTGVVRMWSAISDEDFPHKTGKHIMKCLSRHALTCFTSAALCLTQLTATGRPETDTDRLAPVREALSMGLPSVAIKRAEALGPLDPAHEADRVRLLATAFRAGGQPGKAIEVLSRLRLPTGADSFLLAECAMEVGDWARAVDWYRASQGERGEMALRGMARALANSGQVDEAIDLLEERADGFDTRLELARLYLAKGDLRSCFEALSVATPPDENGGVRRDLVLARALFEQGDDERVRGVLSDLRPDDPDLAFQCAILLAPSLSRLGENAAAEDVLQDFISSHPNHPELPDAFSRLHQITTLNPSPSSSQYRQWMRDESSPERAALAMYYLGLNEWHLNRLGRSRRAFEAFLEFDPAHSLVSEARARLALISLREEDPGEALAILEDDPAPQAAHVRGLALVALGRFDEAAAEFRKTGTEKLPINARLAGLIAHPLREPSADESPELALIRAFLLLRNQYPQGEHLLHQLSETGNHGVADLARLALAEYYHESGEPDRARAELRLISDRSPETTERQRALEVFLTDDGSPTSEIQVARLAEAFLDEFPRSQLAPKVRMKLAESLYRRGDYLGARAEFDRIIESAPGTPLAEGAAFLRAESVARSMDPESREEAIELYEELARTPGPLALRARYSQALLLNSLNRNDEAIVVLDKVLTSNPPEELKRTALIEKGDSFYRMGSPEALLEAINTWSPLTEPEIPANWRNQALIKTATAKEKLGDTDGALDLLIRAMDDNRQDEFFWSDKAGFEAARILEDRDRIREAAAVYQQLKSRNGPRSDEAAKRLERLELENFLWD